MSPQLHLGERLIRVAKLNTMILATAIAVVGGGMAAAQPRGPVVPPPPAPALAAPPAPAMVAPPAPAPAMVAPAGLAAPAAEASLPPGASAAIAAAAKPRPSRWQAELDRLDSDLRLRLLAVNSPREHWLAAQFDVTDIALQVENLASARVAAPDNRLYLATLAFACMQPTHPQLPACAEVDRLADWATRDRDNGVPAFLLGYRARERGENAASVAAYVEEAAAAPRFDDYWSMGPQQWWGYLDTLAIGVDPAVKAKAAATYALEHDLGWTFALRVLCVETRASGDPVRPACAKLGLAMAERASTFALRRAGARIAEVDAPGADARDSARKLQAAIVVANARCTVAGPDFENALESSATTERAKGVGEFGDWVNAQARSGEVAACEQAVAATPTPR
jgi:hypothetical protein